MKFAFYFFIIAQILNFLSLSAEKVKKDSSEFNPIKWEKITVDEVKPSRKIFWKSYKDDKSYFEKINLQNQSKENIDKAQEKSSTWRDRTLRFSFEEIDMPDAGEQMGLYSIGAYEQLNPWLYGGITFYGAATGRRGGFFTGGYTLGVERQLFIT